MLSNALHTLIAALFARIFGRLDELLRLWQTGLLPPPPVRQAPTSRVTTPQTNRRRASAPGAPRRSRTPGIKAPQPSTDSRPRANNGVAPSATSRPRARPRPSRRPPDTRSPGFQQRSAWTESPSHIYFITI